MEDNNWNEKKNDWKEKIDNLNSLERKELKAQHLKQMKEGEIDKKGGAGLGFTDIMRKTGSKLNYKFIPYGNGYYFVNAITITGKNL